MSEQLGQAAGTAEPEVSPIDLLKPWHLNPHNRGMVLDAKGGAVAVCLNSRRLNEYNDPVAAAAHARHIVACVNFCAGMDTETLEVLTSNQFSIHISRISLDALDAGARIVHFNLVERRRRGDPPNSDGPSLRKQLSQAREQFVRDLRNGRAILRGALPGGAI